MVFYVNFNKFCQGQPLRSQLDYFDTIYDQASAFHDKLESIQYNACLAITGAIRGTSTEKIYQEVGLESLISRRWFRKLCHFYKVFNDKSPSYLCNLLPNFNRVHNTRLSYNIPPIKVRHDYFKKSFFPSAISEWNKHDLNIRNSASLNAFKKKRLNFIWPSVNSIFDIHNPLGIKLLTRLRLGLSPLHVPKILSQQCISFSTAQISVSLDKPFFRKLGTLMKTFYLKVKRN